MPSHRKARRSDKIARIAHMKRIAIIEKLEDRAAAGSMLISLPGGLLSLLPDVTLSLPYSLPQPEQDAHGRTQRTATSRGAVATELPKSALPPSTARPMRHPRNARPMLPTDQPSSSFPTRRDAADQDPFAPWPFDAGDQDATRNYASQSAPLFVTPESSGGGSAGSSSSFAGAGFAPSAGDTASPGGFTAGDSSATFSGGGGEGEASTSVLDGNLAPADTTNNAGATTEEIQHGGTEGTESASTPQPANAPASPAPITLRDFPPDLASGGWTTAESGGTSPGEGTVTVVDGDAVLCEGNSFLVTLSYTFTVPENSGDLTFTYTNLDLDTTDPAFINDAFEVALVDQDGFSIVSTFNPSRDAYFNISEGIPAALGSGVTDSGQTVTVSLADVPVGLEATLIFRLINNDSDTRSCVAITGVGGIYQNEPPVIDPLPGLQAAEGTAVDLSATFSDSGTQDTHTAVVEWGDGTTGPAVVTHANGQGTVAAQHVYADNGVYSLALTVTDNSQDSATTTTTATITNVAPTLEAGLGFEAVWIGSQYYVGALLSGHFTDPGFDQPTAGTQERFNVQIDWGDGTTAAADTVDVTQGSPGILTAGTFTASHTYTTGGTFTVTATLCDDDGGCVSQSFRYGVMLIDIKPAVRESGGSGYDATLPEGLIPVVMFAAPTLDATQIAASSLRFFPGAAHEWDSRLNLVDAAPQDGRTDAVAHFSTWDARIQPTDHVGWVVGRLSDGTPLLGVDLIGVNPASARIPFAYADLPEWLRFGTPWVAGGNAAEGESSSPLAPVLRGEGWGEGDVLDGRNMDGRKMEESPGSMNYVSAINFSAIGPPESAFLSIQNAAEGESTPAFSSGLFGPNPANPLDVNADGTPTPLDALLVINALNVDPTPTAPSMLVAAAPAAPVVYLDVTGDGRLTPLDVLWVINGLNLLALGLTPPTPPNTQDSPPPQSDVGDTLLGGDGQVTFTSSADFELGTLFNVNVTDVPNELRLNPPGETQTYPFMWVVNTNEGTVSLFDTGTGKELGRYRTGAESQATWLSPRRLAVTSDGDAWVANFAETHQATIVKVLQTGYEDRDHDGKVDTCIDTNGDGRITGNEILPWDSNGDGKPDDERIKMVVEVGRSQSNLNEKRINGLARSMAIDANNKVWVGLYNFRQYEVYNNETGAVEAVVPTPNRPYGATVDSNGQLWGSAVSESRIDHIDTVNQKYVNSITVDTPYGITQDPDGVIWAACWTAKKLMRYDPRQPIVSGQNPRYYNSPNGESELRGVAVDQNRNVWVASTASDRLIKFVFGADHATLVSKATVNVGDGPTAAVVDADGYVWTTCINDDSAWKINPATNQPVVWSSTGLKYVKTGDNPYNYSDLTGRVRIAFTERTGTWTEVIDSENGGQAWGTVVVDRQAPTPSIVRLRVRSADSRSLLDSLPWKTVASSQSIADLRGRFLQVEVALLSSDAQATPSVQAITVVAIPSPAISILSPADAAELAAFQPVVISGNARAVTQVGSTQTPTAVPNRIVAVLVNGVAVDAMDSAGNFFLQTTIVPGDNAFEITAIDALGQRATETVTVFGTELSEGTVEDQLFDVSPSFRAAYARTSFDEGTDLLYAQLAIKNVGQYPADNPFLVGVTNIRDPRTGLPIPSISARQTAGMTAAGIPYYNLTEQVPNDSLKQNEITGFVDAVFHNPGRVPFTYDLVFLAKLNEPPAFSSVPVLHAYLGRPYSYDAEAVDPDGDPLTYSLVTAPRGMTIGTQTGFTNWTPTEANRGSQQLVIRVHDSRGGAAEQSFTIDVDDLPPNRPPIITSLPVTEATVSTVTSTLSQVVDLTNWKPVVFENTYGMGDGSPNTLPNWILGSAPTSVEQRSNANASILLSDFPLVNDRMEGTWRVDDTGGDPPRIDNIDDDFMGFVFGYQDNQHFYLFDWKQARQTYMGADGQPGMTVKLVDASSPLGVMDLWNTAGNGDRVKTLYHNSIPWQNHTDYGFSLVFQPGQFTITVRQGPAVLDTFRLYDATYTSGKFGFYNYSQPRVSYRGFTRQTVPEITYRYDADAVDPDSDPVTYSLVSGPDGMQMNPDTGLITWGPTVSQLDMAGQVGQDPTLPVVLGFDVAVYAQVTDPQDLSFDAAGTLYVGRDNSGSGGGNLDPLRIHRVQPGGAIVKELGDIAIYDPDTVLFDSTGKFAGTPRSVLVGGFTQSSGGSGSISAILPDGSVRTVFGPSSVLGNVTSMTYDNTGRLLFVNAATSQVLVSDGGLPDVLFKPSSVDINRIAIAADNRIFTNGSDGTIRIYGLDGSLIDPAFATGVGALSRIAFGIGGVWGTDLYCVNQTTAELLRIDTSGKATVLATGIDGQFAFGPDGALYVTDFDNDRILRIAPNRERLGLAGNEHPVTISAADGRGGFDTQSFVVRVEPQPGNHPPVIVSEPVKVIVPGGTYAYDVDAIDPDENVLTYELIESPAGMRIDKGTGKIDWVPDDALSAPNVVFHDGDFRLDNWMVETIVHNNAGTISTTRPASGGNTGSYQRDQINVGEATHADDINWIQEYFWNTKAIYDPSRQGVLLSIDYAEDVAVFRAHDNLRAGLAIRQDGKIYELKFYPGTSSSWSTREFLHLTHVDFGSAGSHPDFSTTGSPIQFGFVRWLGSRVGGTAVSGEVGIDNWTVTITPAPRFSVTTKVSDGCGGSDRQSFVLEAGMEANLSGFVFNDSNGDGKWSRSSDLLVGTSSDGANRYLAGGEAIIEQMGPGSTGFAQGPDGKVYASAYGAHDPIVVYKEASGDMLYRISDQGRMGFVWGLAFGPDGRLYLSNQSDDTILAYDLNTTQVSVFASGNGLDDPRGIAFGPDGNLYVVSIGNQRILKFSPSGSYLGVYATITGGPQNIVFDEEGDLFVTLFTGDSVARIDSDTHQVSSFVASGAGGLDGAVGLAFGPDGDLYVSSLNTGQILSFDGTRGEFRRVVVNEGSGFLPYGVFFTTNNVGEEAGLAGWPIYVDENRNGRRDASEPSIVTEQYGQYSIGGLAPGEYVVRAEPELGWVQTSPANQRHVVTVAGGETTYNVDFGNRQGNPSDENLSPKFTSTPSSTANINELYRYDAIASGPNNDPFTFDLPLAPAGMTVHPDRGIVVWRPTIAQVGQNQVVLRVSDGRGGVDIQSFTIDVAAPNTAPVITTESLPAMILAGSPLQVFMTAQDAEGDAITWSLTSTAGEVDPPTVSSKTGVLDWTPGASQLGTHQLTVTATDARGAASSKTFDLQVVDVLSNDPPVITSKPRTTTRIDMPYAYVVVAHDPNGAPLTFALHADKPAGMTIGADGIVRWEPSGADLGTHPITVTVSDPRGGQVSQEFQLQVVADAVNTAPRITSNPPLQALLNSTYKYPAAAYDAEGDAVIWALDDAPRGMSVDALTGQIYWTPRPEHAGAANPVVLRVTDMFGATATQSFDVAVRSVNRPPMILSAAQTEAFVDEAYVYAVQARDPDGDAVEFSLLENLYPAGMTIDTRTGLIEWLPDAADTGPHAVSVLARDTYGGIDIQSFSVQVSDKNLNFGPTITSTPVFSVSAGHEYVYQPRATDPEGDAITFSLEGEDLPVEQTIAPDGKITWTPSVSDVGLYVLTVVATDTALNRARQTYTLQVRQNQPPTIRSTAPVTGSAGLPYKYDVWATDPEGDSLAYELVEAPDRMTVDAQGRVRWLPDVNLDNQSFAVHVIVRDPFGGTAEQSYQLKLEPDMVKPWVQLSASSNRIDRNGSVRFQVRATDNIGIATVALLVGGRQVALREENGLHVADVVFDSPGSTVVVATATDLAGNATTTDPWQVAVLDPNDKQHPIVTIHALIPQVYDQATGGLKDGTPIVGDALRHSPMLTYLTDVEVSITDDNMAEWRIEYAPTRLVDTGNIGADDPDYVWLGDGTGVIDHRRFRIDTTLRANDAYLLRVIGYDVNGRGWAEGLAFGISGAAKLGNFAFTVTDLSVPLAGIPITISRTYDTLQAKVEGDFGYGWSLAIGAADIAETTRAGAEMQPGDRVYLTNPEGKRVGFTYEPQLIQHGGLFSAGIEYIPKFKSDPGVYDRLSVKEGSYLRGGIFGPLHVALGTPWNPSQYALTTKDGAVYEYTQGDGLQKITDRNGNAVTFTDTAIEHSGGAKIDLLRDSRGRITQIIDTADNSVHYKYNAARDLVKFTNQAGEATTYVYRSEPAHFLDEIYDSQNVRIFKAEFDASGRLTGSIDALGNVVQQEFKTAAFEGTITDARGNVTTLKYNERGNVLAKTDSEGNTTLYEYGDARHPDKETKITDRNGVVEKRVYDAAGNMTQVTRAFGTPQQVTTNYAYDSRGNVIGLGQTGQPPTVFQYGTADHLTKIVNALGVTATATYDAQGRQTSFTDFNGNATVYDYAAGCPCGSPGLITYQDGTYEAMQYNRYGQVTRRDIFEANGTLVETTSTEYDLQGRTIREVFGSGADRMEKRYIYSGNLLDWEIVVHPQSLDANGRLLESPATLVAQRQSRITDYTYDAAGRMIRQTDAEGGVVGFRYDANGNRVLLQDPVGNITTWVYDAVNRMVEERDPFYWVELVASRPDLASLSNAELLEQIAPIVPDPDADPLYDDPSGASAALNQGAPHVRVYVYDGEGNQTKIINRNGRRREFTYDALSRLTEERWYDPDGSLVRTIASTYDARGNLQSITDPDSKYTYTYDTLNRVTSVDNADTPDMPHVVLSYQYDAIGNVLRTSDNLGVSVVSTYDDRNRLASRWWEGDSVDAARVDFLYTAAGREARIDRYSDLAGTTRVAYTDRTYDTAGRSQMISHQRAVDDVIARYDYEYDFAGLLDHEDRSGESSPNNDWHADYTYDRTGQLLGADYSGADVIPEQVDEYYRYDANGNRTSSYLHGTGYRTGPANQLETDGTYNYAYDGEGNMVRKTEIATGKVTTFEYDHRNLMCRATIWSSDPASGGVILHEEQYRYDVMNRRTAIIVDSDGVGPEPTEVTNIIYNSDNAWADFGPDGAVKAGYLFGNGSDSNVARFRLGERTAWYLTDKLGTVRSNVGNGGTILNRVDYTSFGAIVRQTEVSISDRFLFTGREYDAATNAYYYRARFYDARVARFMAADGIGYRSGDNNLYRYVGNVPTNAIDPSGNFSLVSVAIFTNNILWAFHGVLGVAGALAHYFALQVTATQFWTNPTTHTYEKMPMYDLGPGDAFRHALATCWLGRWLSPQVAEYMGWFREVGGGVEKAMDLVNNHIGAFDLARRTGDCGDLARAATEDRTLFWLSEEYAKKYS